jgi:hypothetical protein
LKDVLGLTLSGILLAALALIVGIVLYCKKLRENEPQHLANPYYSIIMVPGAASVFYAEDRQVIKRIYQTALRRGADWQTDRWQKHFCIME